MSFHRELACKSKSDAPPVTRVLGQLQANLAPLGSALHSCRGREATGAPGFHQDAKAAVGIHDFLAAHPNSQPFPLE